MSYPNPFYVDGLQSVVSLSVYCYNNSATYMTYSGDPSSGSAQTLLQNSDKQFIGSVTYIDGRKGTLNCQYQLATDEQPGSANELKGGYIVQFRGRFYVVSDVKTPITKNDVIKFSATITELQNPFIAGLLSTLGQQFKETIASGGSHTVSCAATGKRTGATLTYSVETFATPGAAAPSGFTINSSTGLLTVDNTVTAGTYDVRVVVKDDIGDGNPCYGFGRYTPTLT
jgi:hypothetical protein